MVKDVSFSETAFEVLKMLWEDDPVFATACGIHDYDDRLGKITEEAVESHLAQVRNAIARLEKIGPLTDREDEGDRKALLAVLRNALLEWEGIGWHRKEPALYADHALYGLYLLIARDFAPHRERMECLRLRLQEVRRVLKECRETLRPNQVPTIFIEMALESAKGAERFLAEVVPAEADRLEDPPLRREILRSADAAGQAFREWKDWIEQEGAPKANGPAGIGRDLFVEKLRHVHLLDRDPEELRQLGEDILSATLSQMAELALKLDPTKNWKELLEEKKSHHPPEDQIVETYQREVERARQFVLEKEIVSLPENDLLRVVETPTFDRPTTPYAAYVAPAPFDQKSEGLFYVTPPNGKEPPEVRQDRLKGHCFFSLPIIVVHEAYPGHHLQLSVARRLASPVRKVFGDTVSVEGWALYCEELMLEQGFSDDLVVRLFQLKDLLWRAVRCVVDVGIHCQSMTPEEAVRRLVEDAHLEFSNAAAEVRRYCASPTQPLSYLTGKMEIVKLRKEAEKREGNRFRLRDFHDRLLRTCNWPISLIRGVLLGG